MASSLVSSVSGIAECVFATLFPSDCRLCGAPLTQISRLPVCRQCLGAMRPMRPPTCSVCSERLFTEEGDGLCELCRRIAPPFTKAAAYGSYDGGLRELIHLLKYEHVRTASNVLGRMLAEVIAALKPSFGDAALVVVPVPLHPSKMRQRGFNQAELIARAALKLKPAGDQLACNGSVLERRRDTQSQTGLSNHQRRENIRGAFAVALPREIEGRE